MFANVPTTASGPLSSGLQQRPDNADTDEDNISITSTNADVNNAGSDNDWFVDDILAERLNPDNPSETQYLIKWENFPLEESTWEPIENLGDGLLPQWEECKREVAAGRREAFDVRHYDAACQAKRTRHVRRNAKRKRMGLQLTVPLPPASEDESSESAEEDFVVPDDDPSGCTQVAKRRATATTASSSSAYPAQTQPQIDKETKNPPEAFRTTQPKQQPNGLDTSADTAPKPSVTTKPKPPRPDPPSKRSNEKGRPTGGGTITGYQGTARKPNTTVDKNEPKALPPAVPKAPAAASLPPPRPVQTAPRRSLLAGNSGAKRLTATRTPQQPKERKERANLGDVMADPTKGPKQFSSMRKMNLARKRAIEKEEMAVGSFSSIPAHFLLTPSGSSTTPKSGHNTSIDSGKESREGAALTAKLPAPPNPPVPSPVAEQPLGSKKAKKSVCFTAVEDGEPSTSGIGSFGDTDVVYDEPMDIDSLSPDTDPTQAIPAAPPRKLSLAGYQARGNSQVVSKSAILGGDGTPETRILFNSVPRYSDAWLTAFLDHECLRLDTTCTLENLQAQMTLQPPLIAKKVSIGTLEAAFQDQKARLLNVAAWLRQMSSCLHLVTELYSILVYPNNHDIWQFLGNDADSAKPEAPLKYIIYKSNVDSTLWPPGSLHDTEPEMVDLEQASSIKLLIKDLADLDFDSTLPQDLTRKNSQVYMLLFPAREDQISSIVKAWLRSCQPDCRIFCLEHEKSWLKFHELVKRAGSLSGTIIIHKDVSPHLSKIRKVWPLLENPLHTFWELTTGEHDPPRYPSDIEAFFKPGTLQMTRLFPTGRVFLITPSFVLSNPARLCDFLSWFRDFAGNPHHLIVACHNFPLYLKEILVEKEREREAWLELNPTDKHIESHLVERARSYQDLEDHWQAIELLNEIMERNGDEETSEDIRKVYWLGESGELIDPNDEQSLVNLFSTFTMQKMDQYRRFYVLGSSSKNTLAAYRYIPIPRYSQDTVSDPDEAAVRDSAEYVIQSRGSSGHRQVPRNDPTALEQQPLVCKSSSTRLMRSDRAEDIKAWLKDYISGIGSNWATIHVNPVSWKDIPMADRFGDQRCTFDTFKNWFYALPPITSKRNTYYGLFYTISDPWNTEQLQNTYYCHPWIAVIRPVNPHMLKRRAFPEIRGLELFIWDIDLRNKDTHNPNSGGLLDMQRQLVEWLLVEVPLKFPGSFLQNVWKSDKSGIEDLSGEYPLDATCRRIEEMMGDGYRLIPTHPGQLHGRGWVHVDPRDLISDKTKFPRVKPKIKAAKIPQNPSDANKPERLICHAPQRPSHSALPEDETKCFNGLYEAALRARLDDPDCANMKYQYRPTLEWYADYYEEHRDHGYICVDTGERVVARLRKR
ncbi:hypothetical protein F5Y15DRAFT_178307 [Xylariaceae sp. FL0016]|nr:hypothetical protein F5Y15DRAFT_178307 [Xylariaceae sp. FL0016]